MPGSSPFSKFPKQPKDYGQAYPAICGQATASAVGQPETALTASTNTCETHNGFYIVSDDVPKEVQQYTQSTIGGIVQDLFDLDKITVGVPFQLSGALYDLYYFVIYFNDNIVGFYRVYEDDNGDCTGIFSENPDIISGLNRIKGLTSKVTPAKIVAGEYDDIHVVIDGSIYTILEDAQGNKTAENTLLVQPKTTSAETIVDVSKGIDFDMPVTTKAAPETYKYLQIGWAETQGSLPWCNAYATASIMRYKTGKGNATHSARKVMQSMYPNHTTAQLEAQALSISKSIKYARKFKIYPKYQFTRRTWPQVKSDISSNSPLIFVCDNLNTGKKGSHAFVCRGWNDNSGNPFYSVWNPWYTSFERIYTSNHTYVNSAGTAKYRWSSTVYNWK